MLRNFEYNRDQIYLPAPQRAGPTQECIVAFWRALSATQQGLIKQLANAGGELTQGGVLVNLPFLQRDHSRLRRLKSGINVACDAAGIGANSSSTESEMATPAFTPSARQILRVSGLGRRTCSCERLKFCPPSSAAGGGSIYPYLRMSAIILSHPIPYRASHRNCTLRPVVELRIPDPHPSTPFLQK